MRFMSFTLCLFIIFVCIQTLCNAEWVCQQGVPYKENECNECTCTENNKLACGDKGCLDPIESLLFNCEVGTISQRGCNNCECVKDIGTVCTNREC